MIGCISIAFGLSRSQDRDVLLVDEIRNSIYQMSPQRPFVTFDMKLTCDDINCLNNLRIDIYDEYDNYGNLDSFNDALNTFLKSLGNEIEASNTATSLILNLVNQVLVASGKETAWITLRASPKSTAFDIPRWHTDGYFYNLDVEERDEQYKVIIVLKGPQTLFYDLPSDMREMFNVLCLRDDRDALAQMLDITQSTSAQLYHGAIFIVGADYSAVHSEPAIHEDRLFLSILPGSKKQIEELYNRWHPAEG